MKKILIITVFSLVFIGLTACGATQREDVVVDALPAGVEYNEDTGLVEFPDDMFIELDLFSGFGAGSPNTAATNEIVSRFEDLYPNISINHSPQGNYDDLRRVVVELLRVGDAPHIIMGYPDHYAEYAENNAVVPLDEYINHDLIGVDLSEYVDIFIEENQQLEVQYSMPYFKSTEIIVYNKDKFDAAGITFEENQLLTWDYLQNTLTPAMVGGGHCDFVVAMGSSANSFINLLRQWDAGYTTSQGDILFLNNNNTETMLARLKTMFDDRTIVSPAAEWNHDYGSPQFQAGQACMIQSSSAGAGYNIPTGPNAFDYGILPAIQKNATAEDGSQSVMQQGPNIAIGADSNDYERLASWLFIEFSTNADNSAYMATYANYLPVRDASYDTETWRNFIETTDRDILPFARAASAALAQQEYWNFDPAFAGRVSSSRVRTYVGDAFETFYDHRNIDTVMNMLKDNLG